MNITSKSAGTSTSNVGTANGSKNQIKAVVAGVGYNITLPKTALRKGFDKTALISLQKDGIAVFVALKNLKKLDENTFRVYVNADWELSVANKDDKSQVVMGKDFIESAKIIGYPVVEANAFDSIFN